MTDKIKKIIYTQQNGRVIIAPTVVKNINIIEMQKRAIIIARFSIITKILIIIFLKFIKYHFIDFS